MTTETKTAANPFVSIDEDLEFPSFSLGGGCFWAVLDRVDQPLVATLAANPNVESACLLNEPAASDQAANAPYLVRLDKPVFAWLQEYLWLEPWGVIVQCDPDMELTVLREHFRQFVMIQDPIGRLVYFRFYDPRVLPGWLEKCKAAEVQHFFGPVNGFWCRQEDQADKFMCITPATDIEEEVADD